MYDVIIVGGGPAGLSAALVLGRCRRRVLLVDLNQLRSPQTPALRAFLTRDGIDPGELRRIGREQLRPYDTVEIHDGQVVDATCDRGRPFRRKLNCVFTARGLVRTGRWESTNVPGLFVAGDASRNVQLAIIAAAEGAEAAFAINTSLHQDRVRAIRAEPPASGALSGSRRTPRRGGRL